jgi:hypothetical protein
MNEFPGPQDRIRRVLDTALSDCTFISSRPEGDGSIFVLLARRQDGREVGVRFRGVNNAAAGPGPNPGGALVVKSVKREGTSLVSKLVPLLKPPGPMYARVRIAVGPATLDIVCQDAEWWEE